MPVSVFLPAFFRFLAALPIASLMAGGITHKEDQ